MALEPANAQHCVGGRQHCQQLQASPPFLPASGCALLRILAPVQSFLHLEFWTLGTAYLLNRIYFDIQYLRRHYVTCATPGTVNPRRAYDWRAGSDADYLRATT